MPTIFISYRRNDSAGYAGWLHALLSESFDRNDLFMDIDSIPFGEDFVRVLENAIANVDVVIALIGPRWLTIADEKGRRLDNPNDYVRLELTGALERDIRVIPALLQDTRMPREEELPDPLKPLAHRQAIDLSPAHFRQDVDTLTKALRQTPSRRRPDGGSRPQRRSGSRPQRRSGFRPQRRSGFRPLEQEIGNSLLILEYADITTLQADVIVSSDDVNLSMSGGVSEAIRRAAGEWVWREARAQAPIPLGEVAITDTGRLVPRTIFHAAVLDSRHPHLTTAQLIRRTTRQCLALCNQLGLHRIAFPALATGAAGLSPEQSALAMMLEITEYLNDPSVRLAVTIALHGRASLELEVLARYYLQVAEFLELIQRIDSVRGTLDRLEAIYRELDLDERAHRIVTSRDSLTRSRARWEEELLRRSPEHPVGDELRARRHDLEGALRGVAELSRTESKRSSRRRGPLSGARERLEQEAIDRWQRAREEIEELQGERLDR